MKPSAKVLVVDDDPFIRDLVTETLRLSAFSVTTVEDGSQAIDLAKTLKPDVVLLDVRLGGDPDGLEVCRRLTANGGGPAVIFLSGLANEEDVEAGYAAGAKGYLTKPFSPLELIESVRAVHERLS